MARTNFLYVDIKVYPASVEEGRHTGYDMDSILMADQPILTRYENCGLADGSYSGLRSALNAWIDMEMSNKGKELLHRDCPKAPK